MRHQHRTSRTNDRPPIADVSTDRLHGGQRWHRSVWKDSRSRARRRHSATRSMSNAIRSQARNYGPLVATLGVADPDHGRRRRVRLDLDERPRRDARSGDTPDIRFPTTGRSSGIPTNVVRRRWSGVRRSPRHRLVEVGTAVLLAGLRHPLVLAKLLASIDAMSSGRSSPVSVPAGWLRSSTPWPCRSSPAASGWTMDRDLPTVWTGRITRISGNTSRSTNVGSSPSHARPGRSPSSSAACPTPRCAARHACRRLGAAGPGQPRPDRDIGRGVQRVHELAEAAGRGSIELRVVYNAADPAAAGERLAASNAPA